MTDWTTFLASEVQRRDQKNSVYFVLIGTTMTAALSVGSYSLWHLPPNWTVEWEAWFLVGGAIYLFLFFPVLRVMLFRLEPQKSARNVCVDLVHHVRFLREFGYPRCGSC